MALAIPSRRRFLIGAGAVLAAPAIVRVASLMPVRMISFAFNTEMVAALDLASGPDRTVYMASYRWRTIGYDGESIERDLSLIARLPLHSGA